MKQFYEAWEAYFLISPLSTDQLENNSDKTRIIENSPLPTDQLKLEKSSLMTNQFVEKFLLVSFTAHYEILSKKKKLDERKWELPLMKQVKNCLKNTGTFCLMRRYLKIFYNFFEYIYISRFHIYTFTRANTWVSPYK